MAVSKGLGSVPRVKDLSGISWSILSIIHIQFELVDICINNYHSIYTYYIDKDTHVCVILYRWNRGRLKRKCSDCLVEEGISLDRLSFQLSTPARDIRVVVISFYF